MILNQKRSIFFSIKKTKAMIPNSKKDQFFFQETTKTQKTHDSKSKKITFL